ncbi:hypothetical protein FHR33_009755 [Nonomuraea dietziae]|uniref:Uncharacterized protein n=1 Tax=Nonomuraea dietziae TaxID=65515 RepID=A0A7W5VSP7_9ACTN|nr:hypothetical protein [Nonomuraea dietziae]
MNSIMLWALGRPRPYHDSPLPLLDSLPSPTPEATLEERHQDATAEDEH